MRRFRVEIAWRDRKGKHVDAFLIAGARDKRNAVNAAYQSWLKKHPGIEDRSHEVTNIKATEQGEGT